MSDPFAEDGWLHERSFEAPHGYSVAPTCCRNSFAYQDGSDDGLDEVNLASARRRDRISSASVRWHT